MNLFRRTQPPNRSEQFAATLPPGPLVQHYGALHALLLHLGAEGDVLAVGEHHLREMARYTQEDPWKRGRRRAW